MRCFFLFSSTRSSIAAAGLLAVGCGRELVFIPSTVAFRAKKNMYINPRSQVTEWESLSSVMHNGINFLNSLFKGKTAVSASKYCVIATVAITFISRV